jgi:hypothetical protein
MFLMCVEMSNFSSSFVFVYKVRYQKTFQKSEKKKKKLAHSLTKTKQKHLPFLAFLHTFISRLCMSRSELFQCSMCATIFFMF